MKTIKINEAITFIAICVLSSVVLCVVLTLMIGLFSSKVDNTEIFKVVDPAFQTVVGALVGIVCGRMSVRASEEPKQPQP
jgi:chromate transport protein ChrA